MTTLTFEVLKQAWEKMVNTRSQDILAVAPYLTNPEEIKISQIPEHETDSTLMVKFNFINKASDDADTAIPQAARFITNWLRSFSDSVRISGSTEYGTRVFEVSKNLKIVNEAAVSIMRRDPKTNKIKKIYRCVGGKKDGKRVANPDDCIGVPDFNKKLKFGMFKRSQKARNSVSKTKTRLTNIVSKRVAKANKRLKKARGF